MALHHSWKERALLIAKRKEGFDGMGLYFKQWTGSVSFSRGYVDGRVVITMVQTKANLDSVTLMAGMSVHCEKLKPYNRLKHKKLHYWKTKIGCYETIHDKS